MRELARDTLAPAVRPLRLLLARYPVPVCCYALCIWSAVLGLVIDSWTGWRIGAVLLYGESLTMAAVPWLFADQTNSLTRSRLICAVHGLVAAVLAGLSGGHTSPLFCWLLLIPLAAYLCGHPRVVAAWAVLAGLLGLLLFYTPAMLPGWWAPTSVQADLLARIGPVGSVVLSLLLGLMAAMQHGTGLAQQRELVSEIQQRELARHDFISKMSHELRTPLTSILGYAEDLAPRTNDPSGERAAETIRRSSRALLASLDDLIEWEHLDRGVLQVKPAACHTVRLISDIHSAIKDMPSPQVANVTAEYDGEVPERLVTDWVLLQKAVVKAAAGALQATGRGGIRLLVRFPIDEPLMELVVAPHGCTWEEDELDKLFAQSAAAPAIAGAFSMALATGLIEILGGRVQRITLEKPNTAALRLTIPYQPFQGADWISPQMESTVDRIPLGPQSRPPRVEDAKILLVEDSADTRALMTFLLSRAGAVVQAVDNGHAAIALAFAAEAKGQPFDVVLMDMQLPKLDGCEATRRLRAQGFTRPIIAFTAQSVQFSRDFCVEAGCDDYITKPFRSYEIIEMVARYANRNLEAMLKS